MLLNFQLRLSVLIVFSGFNMKRSLKAKLIVSFLAVIIICGLVAAPIGTQLIVKGIINQAQDNVRSNLNSAREIYQQEIKIVKDVVSFTALRDSLKDAILASDTPRLSKELQQIKNSEQLDILTLTDKNGKVIARASNPLQTGDNQAGDPVVSTVLTKQQITVCTVILDSQRLAKEGQDLAKQASINLISTQRAKPDPKIQLTSAMCIKAASPIYSDDGRLIGVLYGANLINRNYQLVDKIKDTVYEGVKYKGFDIGACTIFQDDIRVATNVMLNDGNRATGTSMAEDVFKQVVINGKPWINRAYVVDRWYITAYEPIKDLSDKIIGVLAVGVVEDKFLDMRNRAVLLFLGIMLGGMVISFIVANFLARGILHPIKDLIYASGQWAKGNLDYRVTLKTEDEIGTLGKVFNQMAGSLKERDEKLQDFAEQQIMKSERLATLGQLSAGVAHEINNPLGAILMYTHLALEDLEDKETMRKNLERVLAETLRCKDVVKGLFDFAHQTEPKVEQADINATLERTLAVFGNQVLFKNINITKKLTPSLPKILVDVGQIQQVFSNIILNAADAMDGTGQLTVITSRTADQKNIQIEFDDTGCGIPPGHIEKIFEPFFTTKEVGKGTGLGLAVSYGIIARHNGTIEVKSQLGKGTVFIVRLPIKQKEKNDKAS
jgi:two-component system, NtrC family, sensor kinase